MENEFDDHYYFIMQSGYGNLNEYIEPCHLKHIDVKDTWDEPGYEDVTYDIEGKQDFFEHIVIVDYYHKPNVEKEHIYKIWSLTFEVADNEQEKFFKSLGLHSMNDYSYLIDDYDTREEAITAILNYIEEVAERKAWEYVEERRYW